MRRIILFLQLLLGVEMIYAQTETEILNYSRLSYAGSARAAAMGGAFGALGGDISSWNLNPAAVGVFLAVSSPDSFPEKFNTEV